MSEFGLPMQTKLIICRWGWCRKTFSSGRELGAHYIIDHARAEEPVRYGDIPKLRRAEEGVGESFTTTGFMSFPSGTSSQEKEISNTSQDTNRSNAVASLPSPPTTTSSRTRSLPDDGSDDDNNSIFDGVSDVGYEIRSQNQSPAPIFYHSDGEDEARLAFSPPAVLLSDASQRQGTPTFAALSSPTGSPTIPPLCPSPSFSDIIVASTQRGPKRRADSLSYDGPSSQESKASVSSSESCQMVADQLTQLDENANYDLDGAHSQPMEPVAEENFTYSGEIAWDPTQGSHRIDHYSQPTSHMPSHSSRSYGDLTSRRPSLQVQIQNPATPSSSPVQTPSSAPPPHIQRQVWYGVAPKRKKSRGSAISPAAKTHQSSTSGMALDSNSPQASQLREHCGYFPSQVEMPSQKSPYQSQETYDSYPLQTQAPYQSQTFSQ